MNTPKSPVVPFFANKAADRTLVVRTGVQAGAAEQAFKKENLLK